MSGSDWRRARNQGKKQLAALTEAEFHGKDKNTLWLNTPESDRANRRLMKLKKDRGYDDRDFD